ncbi:MAG TPA: DUF6285 domain-containing protein [Methylomirabilota bacterium]|jgi:hypothetical protein
MPNSRPPAAELVEGVRDFLERELLPSLTGDRRFQCRVAINVLAIVARELRLGPAADARELAALAGLLGEDGPLPELRRTLAARIRAGDVDPSSAELLAYVRGALRDALAINSPKWLGDDGGRPVD